MPLDRVSSLVLRVGPGRGSVQCAKDRGPTATAVAGLHHRNHLSLAEICVRTMGCSVNSHPCSAAVRAQSALVNPQVTHTTTSSGWSHLPPPMGRDGGGESRHLHSQPPIFQSCIRGASSIICTGPVGLVVEFAGDRLRREGTVKALGLRIGHARAADLGGRLGACREVADCNPGALCLACSTPF